MICRLIGILIYSKDLKSKKTGFKRDRGVERSMGRGDGECTTDWEKHPLR